MKQSRNNIKISIACALILCWASLSIAKRRVRSIRKTQPITIKKMTAAEEIAAAREEARTQELKSQRKKQCYDLMMIMDSFESEKVDSDNQAMGFDFISSLVQKKFPIIVSDNIVYNICFQKNNSHKIRFKKLLATKPRGGFLPLLFSINLINKDWYCYDHPHAKVMLFIPKNYPIQFAPLSKGNIDDQMKECGFDTSHLKRIDTFSPETLESYLSKKMSLQNNSSISETKGIENAIQTQTSIPIVSAIASMLLIPHAPNEPTWNIYLTGHGYTNYGIAGLYLNDFLLILQHFQKINCSFLHYCTCYAGGVNQKMVRDELSRLNVNFIVSTQGINEEFTYGTALPSFLISPSFTNFFQITEEFFGNPKKFTQERIKQDEWQKDPIAAIVNTIIAKNLLDFTQPFVYIPAIGVFNALTVDSSVKIVTESKVKAHEFENKPMDFTDSHIGTIIIYPDYIGVPVKIKAHTALVSPMKPTSANLDMHIFEEIISKDTLSSFIANCTSFNKKIDGTTLVIKKLKCFDYQHSGITNDYSTPILLENVIIHSIVTRAQQDIYVFFNFNQKTYRLYSSFSLPYAKDSSDKIFEILKNLSAQETSLIKLDNPTGDFLYDFMPEKIKNYFRYNNLLPPINTKRNLTDTVAILESTIDKSTHVQKLGSLQEILLRKQQQIRQQQPQKKETWANYFYRKIKETSQATKNYTQRVGNKIKQLLQYRKQR